MTETILAVSEATLSAIRAELVRLDIDANGDQPCLVAVERFAGDVVRLFDDHADAYWNADELLAELEATADDTAYDDLSLWASDDRRDALRGLYARLDDASERLVVDTDQETGGLTNPAGGSLKLLPCGGAVYVDDVDGYDLLDADEIADLELVTPDAYDASRA